MNLNEWETSDFAPFHRPDWYDQALCRGSGSGRFYPEKGESVVPARAVCRQCPVRKDCLEFALDNIERNGIWGGFTERERRRMRALRNRRKRAAA